jgi:hypothetical protein
MVSRSYAARSPVHEYKIKFRRQAMFRNEIMCRETRGSIKVHGSFSATSPPSNPVPIYSGRDPGPGA